MAMLQSRCAPDYCFLGAQRLREPRAVGQWIRRKNSQLNIIQEPDRPRTGNQITHDEFVHTCEALKVEHVTVDAL